MAGTGRKWLIGCGVGCGVAALLAIFVTVGGGILMTRPFSRAAASQKELQQALGGREDFVPDPGTFRPDRLRDFALVRGDLDPLCADFEAVAAKFRAVEKLDEDGGEPSAGEAVGTILPVVGAAFSMAGKIGKHNELRNRALLERNMGLGEYIWYYVLVYNSWLGHQPNQEFGEAESDGDYSRAERRVLAALLGNHARSLREAGRDDEAALWAAEAEAVLDSDTGVPFGPGGLPARYATLLEPLRGKLGGLYCGATSSFELSQIKKKGLSFRSD